MSDFFNCANYGLRVSYRLKKTTEVVNVDFTGPDKSANSEALKLSLRGEVNYIVTQAFIPEPANV